MAKSHIAQPLLSHSLPTLSHRGGGKSLSRTELSGSSDQRTDRVCQLSIYRLFIKLHLPLLTLHLRRVICSPASRQYAYDCTALWHLCKSSSVRGVKRLCALSSIIPEVLVENVGLEPRSKLPKLVCYHYTTFSISRHYLLVEWRFFIFNCGLLFYLLTPPLITENWSRTSASYLLASKRIIPRVAALSVCRSGHFIPRRPHTAKHFPASLIREQGFCPSKPRKGTSKRFKGVYKVLVWRASEPEVCHPDRPFRCASVFVVPVRASLVGWSCLLGKNHCLDYLLC